MSLFQKLLAAFLLAFFAYGISLPFAAAKEHPQTDPPESAERSGGLGLALTPVPHRRARFLLLNYGFTPSTAELAAETGCIFIIDIGNDDTENEAPMIRIDTARWRVRLDGNWHPLGQETWLSQLKTLEGDPSPVIVLRWQLLPSRLRFGPGDFFNGMIAFYLPQAQSFDLEVNWDYGLAGRSATVPGLQCPGPDLPYPGPSVRLSTGDFSAPRGRSEALFGN